VWCGLSLRAPLSGPEARPSCGLPGATAGVASTAAQAQGAPDTAPEASPDKAASAVRWALAMPDVYAIRHTSVEAYVDPAAFEIKVSRADLLGDLRRPAKAAAYWALAAQCWYVLKRGIADAGEIPPAFGVMWADGAALEVARPAPVRPFKLPFSVWMALARATAMPPLDDEGQQLL
jgi:hypothetical protein